MRRTSSEAIIGARQYLLEARDPYDGAFSDLLETLAGSLKQSVIWQAIDQMIAFVKERLSALEV